MATYNMTLDHQEHYIFLERLRRSGATNMFGATPYLREAFGISEKEATTILLEWMNNYDQIETYLEKNNLVSPRN